MKIPIIERALGEGENASTIFHVGKFSFLQEDDAVIVHNNANAIPVFIRMAQYQTADDAYTAARRMAWTQSRG